MHNCPILFKIILNLLETNVSFMGYMLEMYVFCVKVVF